jgi:phosphopantothenoylcysteine decarboxylase/phosphopantothenate--cysteine ligase
MTRGRIVISAGPTREPIDPVRFISNYSTGTMGMCLAREALRRNYQVTLVTGPVDAAPPKGAQVVSVEQAGQMQRALRSRMRTADVLIMAAAVCDFQPAARRRAKLPRRGRVTLALKATPDIVGRLPRRKGQLFVGFALESGSPLRRARAKLRRKRLDLLVAQHLPAPRRAGQAGLGGATPFGPNPVRAWLLDAQGGTERLGTISKARLAGRLFDAIEQCRSSNGSAA